MSEDVKFFDTDQRINLGIWGLGRGAGFIGSCKYLNIDVAASATTRFTENCPEVFVADEFDGQSGSPRRRNEENGEGSGFLRACCARKYRHDNFQLKHLNPLNIFSEW